MYCLLSIYTSGLEEKRSWDISVCDILPFVICLLEITEKWSLLLLMMIAVNYVWVNDRLDRLFAFLYFSVGSKSPFTDIYLTSLT